MPEISMPEVKLPDVKLPDGLREITRDDIIRAARDLKMPTMPRKIEMPDIDLSRMELPKQISDRLPGRHRPNPILPVAGIVAIGAMFAGLWWLFTSSMTGPRVRSAVNDLKQRVTGERTDIVRYDSDQDLTSLLSDVGDGRSSMGTEPFVSSNGTPQTGAPIATGNL